MSFRLAMASTLVLGAITITTAARADDVPPDAGVGEATPDAGPAELTPEELAELEDALGADAAEASPPRPALAALGAVMNPDLSFIIDVAAAWFSADDNLQGGGHDPTKNGFNLQQLEMAVGKAVDPYFRFDANIVFSQFGVEVEEAYGTTLALPYNLQARVGQFLTRFGRLNPTHPHQWDFVDQPFAIGRVFGGEGNRGVGVELSYLTPLPWFVELVASFSDPVGEGTARSFFGPEALPLETPLDVQSTFAAKQFFELDPDWSLLWGLSLATGPNPTGHDNRSDVWGTDLYLKWRPISRQSEQIVSLQTEWLYRRRQVPDDLLTDVTGYAQLFWRFARRWGTAARWEYGSAADDRGADYLDPAWTEGRQRVAANLTFWPTEFSRLRAQGSVDLPAWQDPVWAVFVAMELSVGAHGAHKF